MAQVSFLRSKLPTKALVKRTWHLVDGRSQVVGRLATRLSILLQGKHKPTFSTNNDDGDTVVVMNCDKVTLTGKKLRNKLYRHHTGFPGGLKEIPAFRMLERTPERVLWRAVRGMLPKNSLRTVRMSRLKLFVGETPHPHTGQLSILPKQVAVANENEADAEFQASTTEFTEAVEFFEEYVARKALTPADFKDDAELFDAAQKAVASNVARRERDEKQDILDAANEKKAREAALAARIAAEQKLREDYEAESKKKDPSSNKARGKAAQNKKVSVDD